MTLFLYFPVRFNIIEEEMIDAMIKLNHYYINQGGKYMRRKRIGMSLVLLVLFLVFGNACTYEPASPVSKNETQKTQGSSGIQATEALTYEEASTATYVYTGEPFIEIHGNIPFFEEDEYTQEAFEEYSPLDELGRCGVAYANICTEVMPTEERGSIRSIKPAGWQSVKYDGLINGGYLYNRCHLIAHELSGEDANKQNLITGTRYMNIEGMLPFENEVARYVKDTQNHVLYRVTPIYTDDNLLVDGVLIEAYSVEDEGSGICFCIFAFNVQPGIVIDYKTGDSHIAEDASNSNQDEDKTEYIVNTGTQKFHDPSCSSATSIKEQNKETIYGTRDELIQSGYEPCGNCKP